MNSEKKSRCKRKKGEEGNSKKTTAAASKSKPKNDNSFLNNNNNKKVENTSRKRDAKSANLQLDPSPIKRPRLDAPSTSRASEAVMPVNKESTEYNMNHPFRGHAIIFHQKKYKMCLSHVAAREGSKNEVNKLWETLMKLDFNVTVYDDLPLWQIQKIIEKLAKKTDHTDVDCIAIIVLTHANKNGSLCTKDQSYKIQELWMPFTADECPTLAGKPKLFFIEACQDEDSDTRRVWEPLPEIDSEDDAYTIPACADFVIVYSTIGGYVSWKDALKCSWFIGSMCDELERLSPCMDLLKIMTRITRRVALYYSGDIYQDLTVDQIKQVPHVHSTLTRDVHFHPKH